MQAVIFIQPDKPHPDKQQAVCLAYAEGRRLRVVSLCRAAADCVALVKSGAIDVVVAAVAVPEDVVDQVEAAGGSVDVVRPDPRPRLRRDAAALVLRLATKGLTAHAIAEVLAIPVADVREAMADQKGSAARSREATGPRDTRRKL